MDAPVQSQSSKQLRCIFALQQGNDSPSLSRQMGQTPDWKEKILTANDTMRGTTEDVENRK